MAKVKIYTVDDSPNSAARSTLAKKNKMNKSHCSQKNEEKNLFWHRKDEHYPF